MNTITTAARRIARDVNATAPAVRAYYDADGQVVTTHAAGMWFADAETRDRETAGAVVALTGRKGRAPLTQREAQDHLDAAAAVAAGTVETVEDYLADLRAAREAI